MLEAASEEMMIPEVYDDGDGITLSFPFDDGFAFSVSMDDDAAEEMINIIRNKLNARR